MFECVVRKFTDRIMPNSVYVGILVPKGLRVVDCALNIYVLVLYSSITLLFVFPQDLMNVAPCLV